MLGEINWILIFGPLAYFLIVGGVLDGYIVFVVMKLRRYGYAFGEALLANVFSMLVGFAAWPFIFPAGFDFAELSMGSYGLLWMLTALSEALVLKVFNRRKRWKVVLMASTFMNTISFIIMYLYFVMIN